MNVEWHPKYRGNLWVHSDEGWCRVRTAAEAAEVTYLMRSYNGATWVRWVVQPKGWTVPRASEVWGA